MRSAVRPSPRRLFTQQPEHTAVHRRGRQRPPSPPAARQRKWRNIMTIVRWDSFRDVAAWQEQMNRTLGFYGPPQEDPRRSAWVPAVDIYSNGPYELVLKAELPDMKEEEFALTVQDNTLTLRGEKKLDAEISDEQRSEERR